MLIKAKFLNAKVLRAGKSTFFFSVSKKIAKSAVQRNKLKRMGRLALRRYAANMEPAAGTTVNFYFTAVPASQAEVDEDISSLVKEIR